MDWDPDDLDELARREEAGQASRTAERERRGAAVAGQIKAAQRRAAVARSTRAAWAADSQRRRAQSAANAAGPEVGIPVAAGRLAASAARKTAGAIRSAAGAPVTVARPLVGASRGFGRVVTGSSSDSAMSRLVGATFGAGLVLVAIAWVTGRDLNITLPPQSAVADKGGLTGTRAPGQTGTVAPGAAESFANTINAINQVQGDLAHLTGRVG